MPPSLEAMNFPIKNGYTNHLQIKDYLNVLDGAFDRWGGDDYFYISLVLAGLTGMREGEIFGLHVDKINFENHKIHIRTQYTQCEFKDKLKTPSSIRDVDMIPFVEEVLKGFIKRNRIFSGLLLKNRRGKYLHVSNMRRDRFLPLMKQLGYPKDFMRIHDFRGTFVDMCLTEEIPPNYVQKMVGHARISTTMDVYSKILSNLNEKSINKLQDAIEIEQNKVKKVR